MRSLSLGLCWASHPLESWDDAALRRSRSFELRELLTVSRRLPKPDVKRSPEKRRSSIFMVNDSHDRLAELGESVGAIRSKVKAAIGRLKYSDSVHSLGSHTPSLCGAEECSSVESSPSRKPPDYQPEQWLREVDSCMKYVREVMRTGKIEMLGGSVSAVLDTLLKLLSSLGEKQRLAGSDTVSETQIADASTRLYKAMTAMLRWSDQQLMTRVLPDLEEEECRPESTQLELLTVELRDALKGLLYFTHGAAAAAKQSASESNNRVSTDSGHAEDLRNGNSAADLPPPKPPHPMQNLVLQQNPPDSSPPPPLPPRKKRSNRHRRRSPPTSGDSGIFEGAQSQDSSSLEEGSGTLTIPSSVDSNSHLFSQESLDDILRKLNICKDGLQARPIQLDLDDSGILDTSLDSQASPVNRDDEDVVTEETEEMVDGKRVCVTRVKRTQKLQAPLSQFAAEKDTQLTPELLRLLRDTRSEVRVTEHQQLHLKGLRQSSIKESPSPESPPEQLSPYDNVAHLPPVPPRRGRVPSVYDNNSSPDLSNPRNFSILEEEEKFVLQSTKTHAVTKKALVDGEVLMQETKENEDNATFSASKSYTFQNGQLVDARGSGSYDEKGVSRIQREAAFSTFYQKRQEDADVSDPPPVPPKRRHVVTYMKIFDNSEGKPDGQETEAQVDFRKSTLASYVHLRNRLCQHEEATRSRHMSFQLSSPEQFSFVSGYRNLMDLWKTTDRVQLPKVIPLPDKSPSPLDKSPPTPVKSPSPRRRMAFPVASVLGALDASDWLLLRKNEDDMEEVRGGCPDALIVYATQPGAHVLLYQEAFLVTYRTFVSPLDLIRRLLWRYHHLLNDPHLSDTQRQRRKAARHTFCLIVRVVDELGQNELTADMLKEVNRFIYRLIEDGELNLARLLRQRFLDRIELKAGFRTILPLSPCGPPPALHSSKCGLLEFKAEAIAEQLTALDSELFQKIEPSEMLLWVQEQSEEKSPNLVNFTEHFNKVSFWVRTRVLEQADQREREKFFLKFVKVMRHLRKLGNFNSYLALLSALESGPVRRLEWSRTAAEALREHSGIMDSSQSFKNYRNALAETKPPCIPYIGLILQDLTFVHVGNPNLMPPEKCAGQKEILNFTKRWQQFTILDSVRRFKAWPYNLKKEERVQLMFGNFENFLNEDDIWTLSESLKPRGARTQFR